MRRQRIAKGSGTSLQEVNRLMKQFADTRKVMKAVTSGGKNPQKMMQQMRQAKAMMKQGGRR